MCRPLVAAPRHLQQHLAHVPAASCDEALGSPATVLPKRAWRPDTNMAFHVHVHVHVPALLIYCSAFIFTLAREADYEASGRNKGLGAKVKTKRPMDKVQTKRARKESTEKERYEQLSGVCEGILLAHMLS